MHPTICPAPFSTITTTTTNQSMEDHNQHQAYCHDNHYLHPVPFDIPASYDYTKSSEQNYQNPDASFVGKYQTQRSQLDYTYHLRYSEERQHLHDKLIDRFHRTKVLDHKHNLVCESPLENWIVFTAGPMGAGKGHTIQWLAKQGLFPIDAFVNVDPDAIRALLPETANYNRIDDLKTGYLTQKEVGYISEVLTIDALQKGRNVLVDGSLRNAHWYLKYFDNLRDIFPILRIAIINVSAHTDTVLARALKRAEVTGRIVPETVILETINALPQSLEILRPKSDYFAHISNENHQDPSLDYCEMRMKGSSDLLWTLRRNGDKYVYHHLEGEQYVDDVLQTWKEKFQDVWTMQCALPVWMPSTEELQGMMELTPHSFNKRLNEYQDHNLSPAALEHKRKTIAATPTDCEEVDFKSCEAKTDGIVTAKS